MQTQSFYKQVKIIPFICLSFILINVTISSIYFARSVGETKILNVRILWSKKRTYQLVDVGKDHFQTGTEGKLYWKVKNYKEALLTIAADRDSSINIYDQFYLWILNIALFIMVYKLKDGTVFSNQVLWGFRLIAGAVMFYPVTKIMSYQISSQCIEKLTNGQFTAQFRNSNILIFLIITYLLIFMSPFIKKAINLQQEQNLTI